MASASAIHSLANAPSILDTKTRTVFFIAKAAV
jgi:hypothetical protein